MAAVTLLSGVSDVNTSTARHPALEFTVFDNLTVSSVTPAGVAGDYNGNGVGSTWRTMCCGAMVAAAERDESIGTVDHDYDAWRARFGNTSGSGSGSGMRQFEPLR